VIPTELDPGLAIDVPAGPRRLVVRAEALAWLDANPATAGTSVITSLPDLSELPGMDLDGWRTWFVDAARRVIRWVPDDGAAVFFQSDIRRGGAWIDKGYLVARAADEERATLVFHKIVCREPPGTATHGRATYSHLLGVTKMERPPPRHPSPDVVPSAGFMAWSKATGVEAGRVACAYVKNEHETRTIVDPFCGHGTVLAVANAMGIDAIGIDLASRKCRAARRLQVELSDGG
jgi:hypothetical protein